MRDGTRTVIDSPCRTCDKPEAHTVGCHGPCEAYQSYAARRRAAIAARAREIRAIDDIKAVKRQRKRGRTSG